MKPKVKASQNNVNVVWKETSPVWNLGFRPGSKDAGQEHLVPLQMFSKT